MFKVNYDEEIKKDTTIDDAYFNACNNNNQKWINYYSHLKDKYDTCYNVKSITIDSTDVEKMKFDAYSNGVLLKLYLECKVKHLFEIEDEITIINDTPLMEEIIYNIIKADWLIDERLLDPYNDDLNRRENYFKALLSVSEDAKDLKIQFRNKLYEYFIYCFEKYKEEKSNETFKHLIK